MLDWNEANHGGHWGVCLVVPRALVDQYYRNNTCNIKLFLINLVFQKQVNSVKPYVLLNCPIL